MLFRRAAVRRPPEPIGTAVKTSSAALQQNPLETVGPMHYVAVQHRRTRVRQMADQNHDAKAHAPAKAAESNTGHTAASHASAPKAADKPAEAPKAAAAPAAAAAKASAPAAAKKAAPARRAKAVKTASAKPARKAAKTSAKAASATAAKTSQAAKSAIRTNTDNLNKGTQTMKNETNKVAERVQAAFGDVNERAKTAMERNTRFAEELTELGRGNVE
ncbi:MAG TPA: hypothetical protein VF655_13245, partial [Allosphingosinicella sp.]